MCFPPPRFMTTSVASCAPSTKTTAFLINLSVSGMGQTGKKGSVAGEPSNGRPCGRGPGQFVLSRVQPKGGQNQALRPGRDVLCESRDDPEVRSGKTGGL